MKTNSLKKTLLFVALLCSSLQVLGVEPQEPPAPCAELKQAAARLQDVYTQLLAKYKSDVGFIRKLRKSQQTWTAYRTAQVEMLFPHGPGPEYGTVYSDCNCSSLAGLTKERIKILEQWLTGIELGDVCTGSRPTKN
jgi:uncharacterized protein YecT (DUF1311 family)